MAVIDNLTVEKKMLERKNRVAWLIAEAQEDPAIDESVVEQFFYAVSKEVEIYKYSGNSSFIQSYMDAQITQNWPFKLFLEFELRNLPWFTVYQYILDRLH